MKTKKKIIKSLLENKEPKTIKQFSKIIGSDYRIVHTAMQRLIQEGAINVTKVGNASLCSMKVNYFSPEVFEVELQRKKAVLNIQRMSQVYKDISKVLNSAHYTLLLKNVENSPDINLILITNDTQIQQKAKRVVELIPLPINLQTYSESLFIEKSKNENIAGVNVILHGIESYYQMKVNK
jgi:predicted transcriptional regulator